MTGPELAARCIKLDRLYLSADNAKGEWVHCSNRSNFDQWRMANQAYRDFVAEYQPELEDGGVDFGEFDAIDRDLAIALKAVGIEAPAQLPARV